MKKSAIYWHSYYFTYTLVEKASRTSLSFIDVQMFYRKTKKFSKFLFLLTQTQMVSLCTLKFFFEELWALPPRSDICLSYGVHVSICNWPSNCQKHWRSTKRCQLFAFQTETIFGIYKKNLLKIKNCFLMFIPSGMNGWNVIAADALRSLCSLLKPEKQFT